MRPRVCRFAYHSSLGGSLHGHFGVGVDAQARIEDAIGDLIAKLVGVTLADRLRSEVDVLRVGLLKGFLHGATLFDAHGVGDSCHLLVFYSRKKIHFLF